MAGDSLAYYITHQNITMEGFFIEKADFTIKTANIDKTGIGTIKFLPPDKYLISIKSNTGIEAFRIYISGDSIQVNDRIDKTYLYGTSQMLKSRFGITTALLPVLFGDYLNDKNLEDNSLKCKNGFTEIEGIAGGTDLRYNVDCRYGKSILTEPVEGVFSSKIQIRFSDFIRTGRKYVPGSIEIRETLSNSMIGIRIQKITIPWRGPLEFIPGKQYNKLPLL